MKRLTTTLVLTAGLLLVFCSMAIGGPRRQPVAMAHARSQFAVAPHKPATRKLARASVVTAGAPTPGPRSSLGARCSLYASPSGSDASGNGNISAPYATLQKLDQALSPGQTGCLRGGSYGGLTAWHQILANGASGARITITSYPGELASVTGWIDVEASYTTLQNIRIDGSNTLYPQHPAGVNCPNHVSQPLTIGGHDDTLQYLDYSQSIPSLRGNAIGVGFWGNSDNTIIRYNTVHDVGGCDFYDHLIYLAHSNNSKIYDNWMWNDPHGWGIKLDPGPQNARIWGNVIDGAGSGFNFANSSGDVPTAGNHVWDNIVMNSVGVSNPDIHWSHQGVLVTSPGLMGASTGNQLYNNDYYNDPGGVSNISGVSSSQLSLRGNTTAAPQFANAAGHDYTLVNGSLAQMTGMPRS
jgi:hypothetical protein